MKSSSAHPSRPSLTDTYCQHTLLSCEVGMSAQTQRGSADPPKCGEIGCEISARVTDKRDWVLCRASLNAQHSPTNVKSEALTSYFRPIIISHKSQTSPDQSIDSMTDEFAVVNVKRNGLPHLISPISYCE